MTAGPVNRALLESFFQSPGQIYDDAKTEGAMDVLADQIDDNYNYVAGIVAGGTGEMLGIINVKSFGAVGNGIADDTAAIQAAINAANSVGKQEVLFPYGTYLYTTLTGTTDIVAYTDGATLNGTTPLTQTSVAALQADNLQRAVNVKQPPYNATGGGVTEDTTVIQNAINYVRDAGGGTVFIPKGTYLVGDLVLYSNITLSGAGWSSILLKKFSASYCVSVNPGSGGSTSVADNQRGITIMDLQIQGTAATDGFSEHKHLINLNAVSDIVINRVELVAPNGDAIYIGSGNTPSIERHNERVTIINSFFDGVVKDNRNGISVIDCDGLTVFNNYFTRLSKSTMPGPIDIEQDANGYHIIKNIYIANNIFKNNGGNGACIQVLLPLPQSSMTVPADNITIENNTIDTTTGVGSAVGVTQAQTTGMTSSFQGVNVKIIGNVGKNINARCFNIQGIKNAILENNRFDNYTSTGLIGFSTSNTDCMDIKLRDNVFKRGGTTDGSGLSVFTVTRLEIVGNRFDDCGNGSLGYGIDFNTGTSNSVSVMDNTFISPTGKMTIAIQKEAAHTFTPATNLMRNNNFNGLSSNFISYLNDNNSGSNFYDTSVLPDTFPLGVSISVVNGDTNLPSAQKQGLLKTERYTTNTAFRKWSIQWYYPANNDATTLADIYFRKGTTSNAWSSWMKLTGV